MDFEQLREAYRRVNALERITRRPAVLEDAYVILHPPGQKLTCAPWPSRHVVSLRNVGGAPVEIASCATAQGVRVLDPSSVSYLPARTLAAARVEVEVDPYTLAADAGEVSLSLELLSASEARTTRTLALPLERPAEPPLAVTHREIAYAAGVLNLHVFGLAAPGAQQAVLHIERGPGGARRYQMSRRDERTFEVAVLTEPASQYAYRYFVDGGFRTDPRSAAAVDIVGVSTPCSILETDSRAREVGVRNLSRRSMTIRVEPASDALSVSPAELRLAAGRDGRVTVTLAKMPPAGSHATEVALHWSGAGSGTLTLPVAVEVAAPGPVPAAGATLDFGVVLAGAGAAAAVRVRNVGTGNLEGYIESEDPRLEGAPFSVGPGAAADVPVKIDVPEGSAAGDHSIDGRLHVVSETLLADRRRTGVAVRYRVEAIVLDPPEIAFQVSAGTAETRAVRIRLPRADKAEALTVSDESLPPWLSIDATKGGVLDVTIDGERWAGTADERVQLAVRLRQRRTGASATLTIAGEFLVPRLEVEPRVVRFDRLAPGDSPTVPVRLRNTGRGALHVQSIVLDHDWLRVEPRAGQGDGDAELVIGVDVEKMRRGRNWGCIELTTNDRSGNRKVTIDVRAKV